MNPDYVHGYSAVENTRLSDQATTLSELLHHDTVFSKGARVLEIGCGVGAQTTIICEKNPFASITSVDISEESVLSAKSRCEKAGYTNVEFLKADLYNLPFHPGTFDCVFICFVLEHLSMPEKALQKIRTVLKPGGQLIAIEGDHGSAFFYPKSEYALKTIGCLNYLQSLSGGDTMIGRRLYPLISSQYFHSVKVSPRMVYADASRPELTEGFTLKTFTAMVEGVKDKALKNNIIDEQSWERGIADLRRTAESDGIFCYTFFKATALK